MTVIMYLTLYDVNLTFMSSVQHLPLMKFSNCKLKSVNENISNGFKMTETVIFKERNISYMKK